MREAAGVAASLPMEDIRDADLAVDVRAFLAAFPPAFDPAAFFGLGLESLEGEAGVANGAGEAVAEGAGSLLLSLSAGFFLLAFLGLDAGAGDAAVSLEDCAAGVLGPAATGVAASVAGFFLGFLGFASAPSAFGFAGFFAFGADGWGVDAAAGVDEEVATLLGSSNSILMDGAAGYGCDVSVAVGYGAAGSGGMDAAICAVRASKSGPVDMATSVAGKPGSEPKSI